MKRFLVFITIIGSLFLANIAQAAWTAETVDNNYAGKFSSICLDNSDLPHISYFDMGTSSLNHAYDGANWTTEIADNSGNVGYYTSIAHDKVTNGKVHISYSDLTNNLPMYATNTNNGWVTISADNSRGIHTSIAIDSNNIPHMSFISNGNILKYASQDPITGKWSSAAIIGSASYSSIAIDSNDAIHIAYFTFGTQDLKYAHTSLGYWSISTVDSANAVGKFPSIAVDSQDNVHISYYDITNQSLKYATNIPGYWVNEVVDAGGSVGKHTSIALDDNDDIHISYYDAANGDLKYAFGQLATGTWTTDTINSANDIGKFSSIAVSSGANPDVHISYYDATGYDLKYVIGP